ncbi:lasso RiPP family leader peptide-containing protein [Amycolatopsis aidingensis]|nr:lasso RiPP family leader peptide-containing protein [Amycolatopsis aidingensis]
MQRTAYETPTVVELGVFAEETGLDAPQNNEEVIGIGDDWIPPFAPKN